MAVDLKNPGGKEILIFGGGAAGLALIYFALSKSSTTTPAAPQQPQSTPGTGGGLGSTGTASTTGGVGTAGFTPGNVFSDISSSVPASTATSSTGVAPVTASPAPSVRGVSQGAGAILGSGGTGSSGPPVAGISGGIANVSVGAKTVYNALRAAGLSAAQAAGVLGNAQNESGFRVDVSAMDTNGAYSYGLVQWNAASHPNASQFVTGNLAHDLQTQVAAIVAAVKRLGLPANATAGQVAGAFASQFEGCVGCQPGGAQYNSRVANANAFYQAILGGQFNAPKATPKPTVISPGVKAITPKAAAGLFPIAGATAPVANRKPVAKAKPKPLAGGVWAAVVSAVTNPFVRVTAAIKPKPAPRPAAYSAGYRGEKRVGY